MRNNNRLIVNKNRWYRQKRWQIALVIITVILLGAGAWALDKKGIIDLPFFSDNDTSDAEINYGPPTEEEKAETERFKDELGEQTNTKPTTNNSSQKQSVTPIISSWGQSGSRAVEVAGYVNGLIENGGTCILTMTNGGQTVSASQAASANAQNTSCGFISIERSQLSAGTWSAVLEYTSPTSQGKSQPQDIGVQ